MGGGLTPLQTLCVATLNFLFFFFFFCISKVKYLNLLLIPGAKLNDHRGTWTGCLGIYI